MTWQCGCYIWSTALYGPETWIRGEVDWIYMDSFKMWCWRRIDKISWTDRVRNEEVLHRVKDKRNSLHSCFFSVCIKCTLPPGGIPIAVCICQIKSSTIKRGKATWVVTSCVGTVF